VFMDVHDGSPVGCQAKTCGNLIIEGT